MKAHPREKIGGGKINVSKKNCAVYNSVEKKRDRIFIKMTEMTKMIENPFYAIYLWRNSVTEGE